MKTVICIDDEVDGLTLGKEYELIESNTPSGYYDKFLIINDLGVKCWYDYNPYGLIKILPSTGVWVEYIGPKRVGYTHGKSYLLLDRNADFNLESSQFYVLDDGGNFRNLTREHVSLKSHIRGEKLKGLGL